MVILVINILLFLELTILFTLMVIVKIYNSLVVVNKDLDVVEFV